MTSDVTSIKRLILIDGSGYIFRAFYALPPMTRSDGTSVNALYGFTRMLIALIKSELTEDNIALAVIFDAMRENFRNDIAPDYKANRLDPPPELKPQFSLIKQAPPAFSLTALEQKGFEADDLIATYAKQATEQNIPVTIYSSDKDLMQLVTKHVTMIDPMKNTPIDEEFVTQKFGVPPALVGDALALAGDSSDNIKGVPKIGIKTAAQLLTEFGSLEHLLANAAKIKQPSRRQNLIDFADQARTARKLVALREDVPNLPPLHSLIPQPVDMAKLSDFLATHEFTSLKKELAPPQKKAESLFEEKTFTLQELDLFLSHAQAQGRMALLMKNDQLWLAHQTGAGVCELNDDSKRILTPFLNDPSLLKIGFHMKELMRHLQLAIEPYEDIAIMDYILEGRKPELDAIKKRYEDGSLISLAQTLRQQLCNKSLLTLYETIERPLIAILTRMEQAGITLDQSHIEKINAQWLKKMSAMEEDIYQEAGRRFTIGSPKQLAHVLFDELKLAAGKKGKSGTFSTDKATLEELDHPLPAKILEWRHLAKLASTYTHALIKQINAHSKRIHSSFAMTATSTGRLSSLHPNLQNIPIRTEEGRAIRQAFIAPQGKILLAADYSQIELRILAHIADVKSLKASLKQNKDIHSITASRLFKTDLAKVSSEQRRRAKAIIFGMVYGISPFGLARQLKIERDHAATLITAFFDHYPEIKVYQERTIKEARTAGYVQTLFGRHIPVSNILDKKVTMRNFAERAAINAPIQGSAADIIKRAMIKITQCNLPAQLLLQVHDELLFEMDTQHEEQVTHAIIHEMRTATEPALCLDVPLEVACNKGHNWNDAHS